MKFPYFVVPWINYDTNMGAAIIAMIVLAVAFIVFLLNAITMDSCEENRKKIREYCYLAFLSLFCFVASVYIGSWIFLLMLFIFVAVIIFFILVFFRELIVNSYYYARYAFWGKEVPEEFKFSPEE